MADTLESILGLTNPTPIIPETIIEEEETTSNNTLESKRLLA